MSTVGSPCLLYLLYGSTCLLYGSPCLLYGSTPLLCTLHYSLQQIAGHHDTSVFHMELPKDTYFLRNIITPGYSRAQETAEEFACVTQVHTHWQVDHGILTYIHTYDRLSK